MKKHFLVLLVVAGFAKALAAQDFVAPLPGRTHVVPAPATRQPLIEGAASKVFRARHPALMLSPFAPKDLGTGSEYVYYEENNPSLGSAQAKARPAGIRLFSITF